MVHSGNYDTIQTNTQSSSEDYISDTSDSDIENDIPPCTDNQGKKCIRYIRFTTYSKSSLGQKKAGKYKTYMLNTTYHLNI